MAEDGLDSVSLAEVRVTLLASGSRSRLFLAGASLCPVSSASGRERFVSGARIGELTALRLSARGALRADMRC